MTLFLFGLTSGATVLTAQYWGKKDLRTIEKILVLECGLRFCEFCIILLAAQIMPEQLLRIFTIEPEVIKEGREVFADRQFSYILWESHRLIFILCEVWNGSLWQRWYICVPCSATFTINAILIFGLLEMPAMGVQGAAIGTLGFQNPGDGTGMCVLESVEQRYQVQDHLLLKQSTF